MRFFLVIYLKCICFISSAQTIGGSAAYNFLHLPANAQLTALGGVNTSYVVNDVGFAVNNPALLHQKLHGQLHVSFNSFLSDIKAYTTAGAYYHKKINTCFGGHLNFIDYGPVPQTDAAGNVSGSFRPVDFVVQVGAAKQYLEKWRYGLNAKFIHSGYQQYQSSAIAFDVGILYADTTSHFSFSVLAKNMGFQVSSFHKEKEDLPFDLQVGITQKLSKAPFGFSITAQHFHQFNILYYDVSVNGDDEKPTNSFFNKLLNHFVLGSCVYIGNHLEASFGYNHLRRSELTMGLQGNGLNGFSAGLRAKFQKLQVQFARASYQRNVAYNQLGLTLHLDQFFGMRDL